MTGIQVLVPPVDAIGEIGTVVEDDNEFFFDTEKGSIPR